MKLPNHRMKNIPMSGGVYEIFQKALKLEKEGKKIIHMEIGRPDFDTPAIAKKAAIKALEDGFVHYTAMAGIDELREAVAQRAKRDIGIEADPDSEIMITAGACEALFSIMMGLLNEGDEILIPSPYFPAYLDQTILSGVNTVPVPLKLENDFRLKVEDIKERITSKTKMLLINTPHNPTGSILEKEDLEEIAELAKEYDLWVISDECYDEFIFESKHISISTLPGMKERTIVVNSASKTFSMTGWRIGYVIAPAEVIKYLNKIHQNMSTCATSFAQKGAVDAYKYGRESINKMVKEFKRRRNLIVSYLDQIDGIEYVKPKGAFYVFFSIKNFGMDASEFCNYILEEAGVAIVPGDSFGEYGKGFVRIAYACSYEEVKEAMDRIKGAIEKLTVSTAADC
ncbi:pyridoxal phosphate-dependent aminotransferase [Paramaledivibacter caminithermalis]|uniref:Aminotransferase n=1 Tax=Paramaledivibacter caminithermalis (strain DSM 15212 / CIP 107654 / DViRD3) TaxID=1121301 RepID=A0A1M6QE98_PARC5|nr:pyridoxal phosphate-dependent aminotransferase [Paramaledivibacter caminithermalis]SHK18440.1 aspartate aminotransferase [Paramaledivibacter caminithermalis DSM 15212]